MTSLIDLTTKSLFCASIVMKVLKILLDLPKLEKLYLDVMLARISKMIKSWVLVLRKLNRVRPD